MTEPINIVLLGLVIVSAAGVLCLAQSPDALERVGSRMRARGRAIVAAREAWKSAYDHCLAEDNRIRAERHELRMLFVDQQVTALIEREKEEIE